LQGQPPKIIDIKKGRDAPPHVEARTPSEEILTWLKITICKEIIEKRKKRKEESPVIKSHNIKGK
jgi:hypothetical protein